MAAREFNHLGHFCFRHLVGEHAADPHAMAMYVQHDLDRLVAPLVEEPFQDVNDELHGRVIVVQDEDFVQARPLCFRPRFGYDPGAGAVSGSVSLA